MRGYGMPQEDSVSTGIFSQDEVDQNEAGIAKIRRAKRELQDTLLGLNVTTKITLTEGTVKALEDAGIV